MLPDPSLFDHIDIGSEDEEDVEIQASSRVSQAVVTGTDWTTETVLRQLERQHILLNPRFQRRNAWTPLRQSRFIESLLLGLPIPPIVLAENKDRRGTYVVIDGKQRLLTLTQFAPTVENNGPEPLKLRGLKIRSDLNGMGYADLLNNPGFSSDIAAFQNQPIRTVVVKNWPDEEFLYTVFHRLNSGSVPLSPQELRQALHPGPFLDFVNEYTQNSKELQIILGIDNPDFRMRDVELLVRFFAFRRFLNTYDGNLKRFLDEACRLLNDSWAREEPAVKRQAEDFANGIRTTVEIFGEDDAFSRWNGKRFERRFNRAVFDVMLYYFADENIRERAKAVAGSIQQAFCRLCSQNPGFSDALQRTTKSISATYVRLSVWGATLQELLAIPIRIPRIANDRIQP